jgi:hypothetical protein
MHLVSQITNGTPLNDATAIVAFIDAITVAVLESYIQRILDVHTGSCASLAASTALEHTCNPNQFWKFCKS